MEAIETGARKLSETAPIAAESPVAATKRPSGPKRRLRSLADLDRRTNAAKSAYALRDQIVEDLGGDLALSAMKRVLIDKIAVLEASLNDLATAYLGGGDVDMIRFSILVNSQRRLLADLGLERRARDVTTTSLSTYLAAKRHEAPTEDDQDIALEQDTEPGEMSDAP